MDNYLEAKEFAWRFLVNEGHIENNPIERDRFAKEFIRETILLNEIRSHSPSEADMVSIGEALEMEATNPDTLGYDVLVALAAEMMRENQRLPDWLASFAADVLEGKRKRPTKRGRDKYDNFLRDFSLWRAVDEVASKFDLPKYTNNELSTKTTAAEIVAEAIRLNVDVVITAYKAFSKKGEITP